MQTIKLALGAGVAALIACSSQLANLGGNDAGQSPTADAAAGSTPPAAGGGLPSGIGLTDQLSALSATQQGALCTWIIQQWTDAGDRASPTPNPDLPPGYAGGNGSNMGCNGTTYSWPFLNQQDCMLNLGQSVCMAPVSALVQCVSSFLNDADFSKSPCMGGCSAYSSVPGCSQTVFLFGDAGACNIALPIAPDAACSFPEGGS